MSVDRSHAMDHVVLVLFENRSFGHGKTFEGVIGKELTNPISDVGRARRRAQAGALYGGDR